MARDETGRRKTKKNTQFEKFKRNGKFTSKHIRQMEERKLNQAQPSDDKPKVSDKKDPKKGKKSKF